MPFQTMPASAGSGSVRVKILWRKEEQTMRYVIALAMALGMATASMVPAVHASDKVDPAKYRDGQVVLQSAVPVNLEIGSASSAVAGSAPNLSGPYQEEHYENQGH
jgi:hypothetical protein